MLSSPDRWNIMLFSQLALISQLYLYYINCYTMIWEMKIIFCLTVVSACEKLSQRYFASFVADQLVGRALHRSFYRWRISPCPMQFCASRKLPIKVPSSVRHWLTIEKTFFESKYPIWHKVIMGLCSCICICVYNL